MEEIIQLDNIDRYNHIRGVETVHPLVTTFDLSIVNLLPAGQFNFGFYTIFLKQSICGELNYGRCPYDYQEGTLLFFAPGQIMGVDRNMPNFEPKGWSLAFHPDLIKGTPLGKNIREYKYFSYDANEALHLSEKENQTVLNCLAEIRYELQQPHDKHRDILIISTIELLLNYCNRFYERQFTTRANIHRDYLKRFEASLRDYIRSGKPQTEGYPSVAWCASELSLSANYFGDLIKRQTGKSAREHIQSVIIDMAKEKLFDPQKSVNTIAFEMGFAYSQHFTRFFKKQTGQTPNSYRILCKRDNLIGIDKKLKHF